ncbi:AAA family ATPase [Agrobacterium vitis]|uniref:ParA family protein n=1 Tax=Agrobacterium vitis TaxID=373 RepID=UPI0012E791C3|nr:ParA family protein [Agrobacterium vitis]MVA80969.1 AAA family ATPase [Agrobacterium vitis]
MTKYAFWNNKGGTGKTSLAFQAISRYAEINPHRKILVIDVCPQANLSELFLGGLTNQGGAKLLQQQGRVPRCSIGGYFQIRLPSPYSVPIFDAHNFIMQPNNYNSAIPGNISMICGDPLLELQANAINTLSNAQIPGTDTWISVVSWVNDLVDKIENEFDDVFVDCNPSFSIYTQIALASVERLILPVMADDSSRRAVQNALSLVYGLSLPSPIYSTYAFSTKLISAGRQLPKVHLIAKNRLTQYMGPASAYYAVLSEIEKDISILLNTHPQYFTFNNIQNGTVEIRDFQTTGVVAFAKGLPFSHLMVGKQTIGGHRVQVKSDYRLHSINAINDLVAKL